jgi:hypothetical protein
MHSVNKLLVGVENIFIFAQVLTILKTTTMKKLLSVLAVAAFLVACNNASETTSTTDSTNVTVDSASPMTAPMDTMKMDTSTRGKADSAIRK